MSDKAYLAALHRVDELKRQRDALAEALRATMEYGNHGHIDRRAAWAMDKARAALAATKEPTQ